MKKINGSTEAISLRLYRVQDGDGRGPWKPGFSGRWVDTNSSQKLQEDVVSAFGLGWRDEIPAGWHCGCACRTLEALLAWFTPVEMRRLEGFGYAPVVIDADAIIRENSDQVIFARRKRLDKGVIALPWRKAA